MASHFKGDPRGKGLMRQLRAENNQQFIKLSFSPHHIWYREADCIIHYTAGIPGEMNEHSNILHCFQDFRWGQFSKQEIWLACQSQQGNHKSKSLPPNYSINPLHQINPQAFTPSSTFTHFLCAYNDSVVRGKKIEKCRHSTLGRIEACVKYFHSI